MKELNFETPDISIIKSIKSGIKIIINNIKTISLGLAIPTLLFALIATVTICGNVGVVKIDYNHYMPYHEISEWFLAKYIIGNIGLRCLVHAMARLHIPLFIQLRQRKKGFLRQDIAHKRLFLFRTPFHTILPACIHCIRNNRRDTRIHKHNGQRMAVDSLYNICGFRFRSVVHLRL